MALFKAIARSKIEQLIASQITEGTGFGLTVFTALLVASTETGNTRTPWKKLTCQLHCTKRQQWIHETFQVLVDAILTHDDRCGRVKRPLFPTP